MNSEHDFEHGPEPADSAPETREPVLFVGGDREEILEPGEPLPDTPSDTWPDEMGSEEAPEREPILYVEPSGQASPQEAEPPSDVTKPTVEEVGYLPPSTNGGPLAQLLDPIRRSVQRNFIGLRGRLEAQVDLKRMAGQSYDHPEGVPEDFVLIYHYHRGSIPPKYHYQYTVRLGPLGAGELRYIGRYGEYEWKRAFQLSTEEFETLYRRVVEQGLFSRHWSRRADDEIPIGGGGASIEATSGGAPAFIHEFLDADQDGGENVRAAEAIFATVHHRIPASIRRRIRRV